MPAGGALAVQSPQRDDGRQGRRDRAVLTRPTMSVRKESAAASRDGGSGGRVDIVGW